MVGYACEAMGLLETGQLDAARAVAGAGLELASDSSWGHELRAVLS